MTMFASRDGETDNVKVGITYGPVATSVLENWQHLRHFHAELGRILDGIDAEKSEKAST